ncbi:Peptidoglycan-associated lipoprotein Pal [Candidatus Bealeia paramacronuclearis]|uniref:Peptidoglycan-associated lipoprotein Pal n=1 Tax=Candidatus Bealeia paramacronuclearis TaxID=1921001 RepID=A0ABZ2C481_9PROT|nr:Peptidoglycan-associated lipoprotein Pal [Candidatus Bealeia paramacronuclearis]
MKLKVISLLAAAAALAACESSSDECLDVAGQGGAAGAHAVMGAATPGSVADFVENVGDRVFFAFDKSAVEAEGMATIERQAGWLKQYGQYTVTIQGHCDSRGTVEYNIALGERRAEAAKRQLVSHGVADARVKVISYGKNRQVVPEDGSEWAYQQNRVAITVLD